MKTLGIDVGSTTLKCALLDEEGNFLFGDYMRHYSRIGETLGDLMEKLAGDWPGEEMAIALSGSAGMGLADELGLPFVQEVYAERIAVRKFCPETDAVIELGGEDAKVLFLSGGFEMRMNGTCAGGTGAFIDQMAALMQVTVPELNELAKRSGKLYTIASRCGVFAKSDIQPLLNQGARKEDVSASIFRAVVNQTVAGLAQGREFKGNILYLGGPLTFLSELRAAFDETLGVTGLCPENSLYYVALGAALGGVGEARDPAALAERLRQGTGAGNYVACAPLFASEEEYAEFRERHRRASDGITELEAPIGPMFLGIDAGSTTVKAVLCDAEGRLFRPFYAPNRGNPVPLVKGYLEELYRDWPDIRIAASAVTGYGEEIIRAAFRLDMGLVETIAHYTAARRFRPDVDFILDIGGQDIKCFQIRNGAIDNIFLNEACSSGCGSFLQTFAEALGYTSQEFAALGLFAKRPVDLGSRCTVFMNSSVKQAQKEGAAVEDIAAGLSISVVKNALYKVIRCAGGEQLGRSIVVQGGTFLNDAVLRAFERETGAEVIRPKFAPIMGAYGAALYAMARRGEGEKSALLGPEELAGFTHTVTAATCQGCTNHCSLTVNTFGDGRKHIAGNRCEKPVSGRAKDLSLNLYAAKLELLGQWMKNESDSGKPTVGLPLGLNMYELLPFWHDFWRSLGFNVLVSPLSDRSLYLRGQYTIPSDTACYPAKLMHGHLEWLLERGPDAIFYPDMSYNTEEGLGVNHFNCPVVAYYPQVLEMNVPKLRGVTFIDDFVSIAEPKQFARRMTEILGKYFPKITPKQVKAAAEAGYAAYRGYFAALREKGEAIWNAAREKGMPIIVLAGRPYHLDPEVNHGIHELISRLGAAVVTEDSVSHLVEAFPVKVRNQWTYHARLYAAAKFVAAAPANVNLVQLVSFGCGVDAITTDEVRSILESAGKIYTQIKIDEISNMGAVNIRLRSLFSAAEGRERQEGK